MLNSVKGITGPRANVRFNRAEYRDLLFDPFSSQMF